jgi:hypothetical protein
MTPVDGHLLLAFSDTVLAGDRANPWVLTLRGGYRGDTSETRPAHPEAGVGTTFNMFSAPTTVECLLAGTCGLFGDLGSFAFGNNTSRTRWIRNTLRYRQTPTN